MSQSDPKQLPNSKKPITNDTNPEKKDSSLNIIGQSIETSQPKNDVFSNASINTINKKIQTLTPESSQMTSQEKKNALLETQIQASQTTSILPQLSNFLKYSSDPSATALKAAAANDTKEHNDHIPVSAALTSLLNNRTNSNIKSFGRVASNSNNGNFLQNTSSHSIHNPLNFNIQLLHHLNSASPINTITTNIPTGANTINGGSSKNDVNNNSSDKPIDENKHALKKKGGQINDDLKTSSMMPLSMQSNSNDLSPHSTENKSGEDETPEPSKLASTSVGEESTPSSSSAPHWMGTTTEKSPFSTDLISSMFNDGSAANDDNIMENTDTSFEDGEKSQDDDQQVSEDSHVSPTPAQDPQQVYPVLEPIAQEIDYMPAVLTSEFLEVFFSNKIYSVAPILRKSSILSLTNSRGCSPALLYSMLYVAAHASNHPIMTSGSPYKTMLISKLLDSIIGHLRPMQDECTHEYDLDDVITYINIGIVAFSSDFNPAGMKWWTSAITLARALKLNKEIHTLPEEAREERRRTWWSLFMIDRHLSLCCNSPCLILDSECLELFFPISQEIWESEQPLCPPEGDRNRRRGLQCTVIETGLFGMYLPLMTLLGCIIEVHFFELSPMYVHRESLLKSLRENISHRLKAFEFSLEEYYTLTKVKGSQAHAWREYCECILQVFYILLEGYWDATAMLDDIDVLLNDDRFDSCLKHSIKASQHIEKILQLDSELQTMPFFFGIQLLQASFIPFCMSERYGSHTSTDVAQACELFVRAHEVSIATLKTQYQINFRSLLHGVIRDMKHTTVSVNDRIASTNRRRVLMSMYRWNAGGTGLAV